jgi:hypothetical protein
MCIPISRLPQLLRTCAVSTTIMCDEGHLVTSDYELRYDRQQSLGRASILRKSSVWLV